MKDSSPIAGKLDLFGNEAIPPEIGTTSPLESMVLNAPPAAKNTFLPEGGVLGVDERFPNSMEAIAISVSM